MLCREMWFLALASSKCGYTGLTRQGCCENQPSATAIASQLTVQAFLGSSPDASSNLQNTLGQSLHTNVEVSYSSSCIGAIPCDSLLGAAKTSVGPPARDHQSSEWDQVTSYHHFNIKSLSCLYWHLRWHKWGPNSPIFNKLISCLYKHLWLCLKNIMCTVCYLGVQSPDFHS
jgi:hypothetical protein